MQKTIKCFTCKENRTVDIDAEDVSQLKNGRYLVNASCEICNRRMTTLIKTSEALSLLSKSDE